jgi:tripartite-type tricarboxylate transporter receptor subunit TctC
VVLPQFRAIVVRSGTDPRIVKRLADTLADAMRDPEYVAFLKDQHADLDGFVPAAKSRTFLDNLLKGTKELVARSGNAQDAAKEVQKK